MEFWGVEVKAKEPSLVKVVENRIIHLSQAVLGEVKKDNDHVTLYVEVGKQKFVLGMLTQNNPQLSFDLVFEQTFKISHNGKNGSVHLLGYSSTGVDDYESLDEDELSEEEEEEDEEVPVLVPTKANGKPVAAANALAKASKDNKPKPAEKVEDEDDSDDDDDSEDDDDSDEDMLEGSDDDDLEDGSEDDDESSDEETPAKADVGKKRSKPDAKTPEPKKAKLTTPQKTDGKKGAPHTATPHPSKKGGKTPGGDKSTPKSNISCGSCKKTFNSDGALQSHNKAKHSAGK